jgi:hypothetical protein
MRSLKLRHKITLPVPAISSAMIISPPLVIVTRLVDFIFPFREYSTQNHQAWVEMK